MRLTTEVLAGFIGGQMEIQNRSEDYLFRGEIVRAVVESGKLRVRFAWLAKNDGGSRHPASGWTAHADLDYTADLEIYHINDVNDVDELGRIIMHSPIVGELCVFFPKGYTNAEGEESKLDRDRVKGL